jgi:alpha-galactosidase
MYYTFYAPRFSGKVELRGLGPGRWRVRDLFDETDLGTIDAGAPTVNAKFERFLMLQATRA